MQRIQSRWLLKQCMDPLTRLLTIVFLASTMAAIGLKVTVREIGAVFDDRGLIARSLAVNLLIVPLVGALLVRIVPLSEGTAAGLLLLAACPGGLNAIQFTSKSKAALCYAASLLFILTMLSVLVSPAIAGVMLGVETSLTVPYGSVIKFLLLYLLAPLMAGLVLHRAAARVADRLSKPFGLCGTVLFIIVVIRLAAQRKQALASMSKTELAVMAVFILLTMTAGWLFGGPSSQTRRILATTTSMRNVALCLLIAVSSFGDTDAVTALIAYSAMMIPPNMLLTVYAVIKERKAPDV